MIHRIPSVQAVEDMIKAAVLAAEFPRGSQVPPERELVERLGVSRTVIREAMKSLQAQGIVSVRHGYGTFVVDDFEQFLTPSMSTLLEMGDISLTETMYARELIEPPLAAYAAEQRTDKEAHELMELVAGMTQSVDDRRRYEELDTDFHLAIASVSGNRLLNQIIQSIRWILRAQIHDLLHQPTLQNAKLLGKEHRLVAEAILRKDAAGAQSAMLSHLQVSTKLMTDQLERQGDRGKQHRGAALV